MGKSKPSSQSKRRRRRTRTWKPAVKRVNADELKATIDSAGSRSLTEEERTELQGVVDTLEFVIRELEEKNLTIRRLRSLFGLKRSEKLKDVFGSTAPGGNADDREQDGASAGAKGGSGEVESAEGVGEGGGSPEKKPAKKPEKKQRRPGHGRNGADAYTSAERIPVAHGTLEPGASCPECDKGRVYEQRHRPRLLVRVEGQAPLKATVYELQAFRCNLCGEVFPADSPEGVGEEKYDATSTAMIGLLKYGSGLPFNRIDRLEQHLGVPLPTSTQWQVVRDGTPKLLPVYEELIHVAAQGEILQNDDTSMPVLSLMKENEELRASGAAKAGARTGIFVTGILSTLGAIQVALFFTGRKHAGENLEALLAERAAELGPPLQMSDALDRNAPGDQKTIRGYCLAHGRRKFVELADVFPAESKHVLEVLGEVYKHDAEARKQELSAEDRLQYHVEQSGPLLEDLKAWFERQLDEKLVEPNSSLGGAINYMLNHWEPLTLFLREPGALLDNNACERSLKKVILHRKNSLFYKTLNGARVGDVFMSLIYTAEINGENPFEYVTELLRHHVEVAKDPAAWLPWNFRGNLRPP